jgi:ATP-dependent RNA helicase DDX52/ROK1
MEGIRVGLVHGNITPARRDEAVRNFREGEVWVLVVTEVLARGMDFRGVKVVVNYGESRVPSSVNEISLRGLRADGAEGKGKSSAWRRAERRESLPG